MIGSRRIAQENLILKTIINAKRTINARRKWTRFDNTQEMGKTSEGSFTFLIKFEFESIECKDSIVAQVKYVQASIPGSKCKAYGRPAFLIFNGKNIEKTIKRTPIRSNGLPIDQKNPKTEDLYLTFKSLFTNPNSNSLDLKTSKNIDKIKFPFFNKLGNLYKHKKSRCKV